MSYRINKTDGSLLVDLIDGTIDTESSDITLIGRNFKGFGELINENFVKMLENFASSSAPANPLRGQLWYDTSENRLKVYNGTQFITNNIILSATPPTGLAAGDIWIDSLNNQMRFFTGSGPTTLVGPVYNRDQGTSGFVIESVLDTQNNNRTVAQLFVNSTLKGVFSGVQFTPIITQAAKVGNLATVYEGFNSLSDNFKWNGVATKAQTLVDGLGVYRNADGFVRKDLPSASAAEIMTGNLSIQGVNGLQIGSGSLNYTSNKLILKSLVGNHDVEIQFNKAAQPVSSAIFVDSSQENVGIKTNTPSAAYALDVNGSTRIQGDLTVTGEMTTVNVVDLTVEDKNIELAAGIELSTTGASGNGSNATLIFATQPTIPFFVGQNITVSGITPSGYTGSYQVTNATVSSVSYLNATTGAQTQAGTVTGFFTEDTVDNGGIVLKTSALTELLTTITATGNGSTATLTFAALIPVSIPFFVGQTITVSGMTPDYNGSHTVTACTTTSVSFNSTETGAQTVAGTVTGTADKSLLWKKNTTSWTSSENMDLAQGKEYKINGTTVLSATALGHTVTSAPGLVSFGSLATLNVGSLLLSGITVSATGNLQLQASTNIIDVLGARITGVDTPTALTDAATKEYVDSSGVLSVMLDVTGLGTGGTLNTNIATLLNDLYPADGYLYSGFNSGLNIPARQPGSLARVHTISLGSVAVTLSSSALNTAAQKGYAAVDQTITASPVTVASVITGLDDPTLGTKVRITTASSNPYEVGHSVTISSSAGLIFDGTFPVTAVISSTQLEIELAPFYNFTATAGSTYTPSSATAARTFVLGLANRTVVKSLTFDNVLGTATAGVTRGLKQFYVQAGSPNVWAWDQDLTPGTLI